ncbi:hypothetical protein [Actibacterium sp. 188UL27-1]|uniref:hypothetical protein n=1 Tax=Actibacterium sp. 188UL27-1 TaxID=2786961 RepID=UPI00195B1CAB|nr:hypothetical protein [Actibacterium sp. 188UL27-1]MBM7069150.1 hypothetical protein [Actibacterium sp. 188UL27-1]
MPAGDWYATITAIEWEVAPGAQAPCTETLPNDVLQFAPAAGLSCNVAPTGMVFVSQGESKPGEAVAEDADRFALFDTPIFMARAITPGALGQVCDINGSGGAPIEPTTHIGCFRWGLRGSWA